MSEQKTSQQPEQDLSEQRRVRREKLAELQANEQPEASSGGMEMT